MRSIQSIGFYGPQKGIMISHAFSPRSVTLTALALLTSLTTACTGIDDATSSVEQLGGVGGPALETAPSVTVGQNIVVNYSGLSGAPSDWITLAVASDPDTSFITYEYTGGGTDGQVTFGSLPVGTYEARAFNDWEGTNSLTVVARTQFTVAASTSSTVTTNAPSYSSGAPITVNYTNLPGTSTDWIALAVPNTPNEMFVAYNYTDGNPNGSVNFAGLPSGQYVARAFGNDSFNLVAESAPFTVGSTVSTTQPTYSDSENIVVNFVGLPPNASNWIALAPSGSADGEYVVYSYLPATASGSVQFAPLPAGNYEARAYLNDSFTRAGTASFSVGNAVGPTVDTSAASYTQGQTVTATYTVTGNPTDWVAVSIAGSSSDQYVQWTYVDPSGTATFNGLAVGSYEIRLYSNNTFTVVASDTFAVTTGTPPAPASVSTASNYPSGAQAVTVGFDSLPGLPGDWIGIAIGGSTDSEFIAYVYTGGAVMGTADFGTLGLADGTYEARAYKNDTFEVLAETTFTVGP